MKKARLLAAMALLCALLTNMTALADEAIIDGKSSDRVHLRQGRSTSSNSLGLYFTGTRVLCESEPVGDWVSVTIGQETGYMMADYLLRGSVGSASATQKLGEISAASSILRQEPSSASAALATLARSTPLTLLGETKNRWYYVQTGGLCGYVYSEDVKGKKVAALPFAETTRWFFYSGAGAWLTELILQPDGSFTGEYGDSDMGDIGTNYPNGTHYYCRFSGQLTLESHPSDQIYQAVVTALQWEDTPDEVRYVDGVREIARLPYGLSQGDRMMLCLTGVDAEHLTEDMLFWVRDNLADGRVAWPVMINLNDGYGFCMQ